MVRLLLVFIQSAVKEKPNEKEEEKSCVVEDWEEKSIIFTKYKALSWQNDARTLVTFTISRS